MRWEISKKIRKKEYTMKNSTLENMKIKIRKLDKTISRTKVPRSKPEIIFDWKHNTILTGGKVIKFQSRKVVDNHETF